MYMYMYIFHSRDDRPIFSEKNTKREMPKKKRYLRMVNVRPKYVKGKNKINLIIFDLLMKRFLINADYIYRY
jgi:hypothetical protein